MFDFKFFDINLCWRPFEKANGGSATWGSGQGRDSKYRKEDKAQGKRIEQHQGIRTRGVKGKCKQSSPTLGFLENWGG